MRLERSSLAKLLCPGGTILRSLDFIRVRTHWRILTGSVPRSDLHFRKFILRVLWKMDFKGAILEEGSPIQRPSQRSKWNEAFTGYILCQILDQKKNVYVVCEYSFCTSLLLIRRANSLKKTLTLGKIEGKRWRGRQRMRCLDGITDPMDMNLSKPWEIMKEAWYATVHRVTKSRTRLSDWTAITMCFCNILCLSLS